jgi:predicted XRE-type DNA-binding protein
MKNLKMLKNWEITTGDVFDDLFERGEAASLKMRSDLMMCLRNEIARRKLTQSEAGRIMDVTQPRVSDLLRGKIQNFTIDMLIIMLVKLGLSISWVIKSPLRCSNLLSGHSSDKK